jgi:PAS domain S-box-containing protein
MMPSRPANPDDPINRYRRIDPVVQREPIRPSARNLLPRIRLTLQPAELLDRSGRIWFMNRAARHAAQIVGDAAINGRFWWDLWPFEVQPLLVHAFRQALNGEPTTFEAFRRNSAGTPQWWMVTISPIVEDDGVARMFLVCAEDITSRKMAQAAKARAAGFSG